MCIQRKQVCDSSEHVPAKGRLPGRAYGVSALAWTSSFHHPAPRARARQQGETCITPDVSVGAFYSNCLVDHPYKRLQMWNSQRRSRVLLLQRDVRAGQIKEIEDISLQRARERERERKKERVCKKICGLMVSCNKKAISLSQRSLMANEANAQQTLVEHRRHNSHLYAPHTAAHLI